jgi:hypothetical protein
MAWAYDNDRTHSELRAAEREVLFALEEKLYFRIVPNIARRPRVIYHYTSDRGLCGILASLGLRATYWRDLFDKDEIKWGIAIINEVMQALRWQLEDETLRELLGVCYHAFVRHEMAQEYYIVCFTEAGQSDRHWVEYGCADEGFCFELDAFSLQNPTIPHAVDLQPVIYDFKEQTDLLGDILLACWASIIKLVRQTSTERLVVWLPHVMSLLTAHLNFHLRLMKTEEFAWEREWRVVIPGPKPGESEDGAKRFIHLPFITKPTMAPILAIAARHAPSLQHLRDVIAANGYIQPELRTDGSSGELLRDSAA